MLMIFVCLLILKDRCIILLIDLLTI